MLVRSLVDGLHRGRRFALCGGPGTGRTSTLQRVVEVIHTRWRRELSATRVAPVVIPCRDVANAAALPGAIWQAVAAAIRDPKLCGGAPPRLPRVDAKGPDGWQTLAAGLQESWQLLRGTEGWCEWALLLDDADALFSRRLESALPALGELLHAEHPGAPSAALLAGGRWLREHLQDAEGALEGLRLLFLGALRESEAIRLLRAGLPDADEDLIHGLLHASGRHPYVLQRIAAELERLGPGAGLEAAVDVAAGDCLDLFDRIWGVLDMERGVTYRGAYAAPEHALLQLLLDLPVACDIKSAERDLGIRPLREYAELLDYCGIGERVVTGNLVKLRAPLELWNIWYGERILR